MDKSLLKIVATELPIGHTQAILESLKSMVQHSNKKSNISPKTQSPAFPLTLIEDFY